MKQALGTKMAGLVAGAQVAISIYGGPVRVIRSNMASHVASRAFFGTNAGVFDLTDKTKRRRFSLSVGYGV